MSSRLNRDQVTILRRIVHSHLVWLEEKLRRAIDRIPQDQAEIDFYVLKTQETRTILELIPARTAVTLEDDLDDEQRDEED